MDKKQCTTIGCRRLGKHILCFEGNPFNFKITSRKVYKCTVCCDNLRRKINNCPYCNKMPTKLNLIYVKEAVKICSYTLCNSCHWALHKHKNNFTAFKYFLTDDNKQAVIKYYSDDFLYLQFVINISGDITKNKTHYYTFKDDIETDKSDKLDESGDSDESTASEDGSAVKRRRINSEISPVTQKFVYSGLFDYNGSQLTYEHMKIITGDDPLAKLQKMETIPVFLKDGKFVIDIELISKE